MAAAAISDNSRNHCAARSAISAGGNQTIGSLAGVAGSTVALGANTLTFGDASNQTFGGVIGGSGGLVKQGTGAETLTGANTYSGGTTINAGSLILGNSSALGTGALTVGGAATIDNTVPLALNNAVVLNAGLTVAGSNDLTLNNVVSGTGSLTKDGPANLTLANANTYSGGTVLNNGTITVGNNTALGTGSLALNGGQLDVNGFQITVSGLNGNGSIALGSGGVTVNGGGAYGGVISGTGTVAKGGSDTLTLTGANTYTGGTTINAGTLQVGNGGTTGSIAGNVVDNGTLAFNRSDNLTYGGVISGAGSVVKLGAGVLDLSGASTYSGPTTVNAGTLAVSGSIANSTVTVNSGATVQGPGTIGGLLVNSGGTAAIAGAGQPIGTLTVAGNAAFTPGSIYQVKATPQQADLISVGGSATLSGGTVQVLAAVGDYKPTNNYTILTAAGGVSGAFSGVTSNLVFLTPSLSYDAKNVFLKLLRNNVSFQQAAATPNQQSVANAVTILGGGNTIYDTITSLDLASAQAAFDSLSGEIHASARSVLLEDSRYIRDAVTARARQGSTARSGTLSALSGGGSATCTADSATQQNDQLRADNACNDDRRNARVVWGQVYGAKSNLDGENGVANVNRSTGGFIVGVDTPLNDTWRAGVAGGIGHSSFDTSRANGSASVDSYHLALYGDARFGALGVRLGTAYTWNKLDTDRTIVFPGFSDSAKSSYDAHTTQVFGELGYAIAAGQVALEPFAGLAYVSLHTDGFSENGGAAALSGKSDSQDVTFSTLGVRAATRLGAPGSSVTARGTVGWRHAFGGVTPTADLAFKSNAAASFAVTGVPVARDAMLVEAGIDVSIGKSATLGLGYSGQFGDKVRDNAIKANIAWKF